MRWHSHRLWQPRLADRGLDQPSLSSSRNNASHNRAHPFLEPGWGHGCVDEFRELKHGDQQQRTQRHAKRR